MFLFQIGSYDDPCLDVETAELFRQRLEARSRQVLPGLWRVTDRLNAYGGRGREKRRRRYRIWGALLMALGVFALVPGLMEPKIPALIWAGGLAVFAGIAGLCLGRGVPRIPASCREAAGSLLAGRRAVDWRGDRVEIRFDETGMTVCAEEVRETVPYHEMTAIFETERLWLLIYEGEKALLLQKRDMIEGQADAFSPYILQRIGAEERGRGR